jgi:DNA polymerase kappa
MDEDMDCTLGSLLVSQSGDEDELPVPKQQLQQSSGSTTTTTSSSSASPNKMAAGPSLMQLNDTKAGMTGLDKEKINQIILNASRDSPFYKRQQERQQIVDQEIADLLHRKSELTLQQIRCAEAEMDKKAVKLEHQRRDMSRIIVHMDMDMFFAAVEMRDNPDLAHVPLAVGSNSMLSTSNYEVIESQNLSLNS